MASLIPRRAMHQCRHFSTSLHLHRRPNIQSPLVPGTERRILDAITVPVFPPDLRSPIQKCIDEKQAKKEKKRSELMEAYNAFRVREAQKMFQDNQMIAICHILPQGSREFHALRATVFTSGFKLVFVKNELALEAISNSRFANLAPYMTSNNAYIVSEDVKLPELIKLLRKVPSLALMGGLVENQILSRDMIMNAAKLPPLDTLRGELLTILSASASKTSRLLGRHTQELSTNLDQLIKQGSDSAGVRGQQESAESSDVRGEKVGGSEEES